ncbi:MAG: magnesium/cobalt transporter CorA [Candidatus Omnitrophica bacterium]|nr:magnesium/cobalt transporter CorA [Candidatus Omnitrophota bacterium]
MVYVGDKKPEKPRITIIDYSQDTFTEKIVENIEDCFGYKDTGTVTWINVDGLHDLKLIEKLGRKFDVHQLILEDIVDTGQRPKIEDAETYLFIILRMIYFDDDENEIKSEQISLILNGTCVISFQETVGDIFDIIRDRIRTGAGKVRKMGADYLAYSLVDAIVDNYFSIIEKTGEKIEDMEEGLLNNPTFENLKTIHELKRGIIQLRRSIWPLREVVNSLEKGESPLIQKTTRVYLRDVYDHTIQVMDTVESFRDTVSGLLDVYLSSMSNRMNEVMKVLTVISTIFMPLTFITGLYGMNFNTEASPLNMPELNWKYGYVFMWSVTLIITVSMVAYFKRKKWF